LKGKEEKMEKRIDYKKPIESVDEQDIEEIMKEYSHIKLDTRGHLYCIDNGIKKIVILPYIPDPNDKTTMRLLFKKRNGAENLPFEYDLIDNTEIVLKELYEKRPIWVKEQDQKVMYKKSKKTNGKENSKKEITYYTRAKSTIPFNDSVGIYLPKSHIKLHQYIMSKYFPAEMKEYRKINDKLKEIQKYNEYAKEYNKTHTRKKKLKEATQQIEIDHFNNNQNDNRLRNLHICFNFENNMKKIIDKNADLNNFFIVYEQKNGHYTGRKFYCVVAFLENEVIDYTREANNYIIIKDTENKRILGRANIICFAYEDFFELTNIIERKEKELNISVRTQFNEEKKKYNNDNEIVLERNRNIAQIMTAIYKNGLDESKKVLAYAEEEKILKDNKKEIAIVEVVRKTRRTIDLKNEKQLSYNNANELLFDIIASDILD
jgi:hypothetical protein